MTRNIFFPIILLGFLTFGSLGFLYFTDGLGGHDVDHYCPIAFAKGSNCPVLHDSIAFLLYHLSGFRSLLQPLVAAVVTISIVLVLLGFQALHNLFADVPFSFGFVSLGKAENISGQKMRLLRWLALRKKRDPRASLSGA